MTGIVPRSPLVQQAATSLKSRPVIFYHRLLWLGVKNVVVNPHKDAPVNQDDRGYVFPDPGLFLGVSTPEGQAKFFYNWLKYRPALIYRLCFRSPRHFVVARSLLHRS